MPSADRPLTNTNGFTGEALKTRLIAFDTVRAQDAKVGVRPSRYTDFSNRANTGPYTIEELTDPSVYEVLSNPKIISVVTCGRNENRRGNLKPTLGYINKATREGRNAIYFDGNSTDRSVTAAQELGVQTIVRQDATDAYVRKNIFAKILKIPPEAFNGKENNNYPPLRKGWDIFVARMYMLRKAMEGEFSPYVAWMDTDYKSIPGGVLAKSLPAEQIYYPLELEVKALIDLQAGREPSIPVWAIFTGSAGRNNEPIAAAWNMFHAQEHNPMLNSDQKNIAQALFVFPGMILHPLTGDVLTYTGAQYGEPITRKLINDYYTQQTGLHQLMGSEIAQIGATGQCVETARMFTYAGDALRVYGGADPELLQAYLPFITNARRGKMERIDEPQPDWKEWWMIQIVITQFIGVIGQYCIQNRKAPWELNMEDYTAINWWLAKLKDGSRIDKEHQARDWDDTPMERIIPPVILLQKEGVINVRR